MYLLEDKVLNTNANPLRVVDLFSGCGGLSLGFDHRSSSKDEVAFKTVLAVDNWKPAVEVFCSNHPSADGASARIGRLADLSWFNHASEALLFYLVHVAASSSDRNLIEELNSLGLTKFISDIAGADADFQSALDELSASPEFKMSMLDVDSKVFSLALAKSVLGKLHLSSLRELKLAGSTLPWVEERSFVEIVDRESSINPSPAVRQAARNQFQSARESVTNAAGSKGKGQHKGNAARMRSLGDFFESVAGGRLKKIWEKWYADRLSIRQDFCLSAYSALRGIYTPDLHVAVVLGGPPCKGFSRIGRAVIRELREQGAHAWACDKFGDERNALMYRYVIFLEALQPSIFLFENVSNFASTLKTPDGEFDAPKLLEELIEGIECEGLEYVIDADIIKAKEYGVAQARERYIMCGVSSRVGGIRPGDVLSLPKKESTVSLGEVISGLPVPRVFRDSGVSSTEVVEVAEPTSRGKNRAADELFNWIRTDREGLRGDVMPDAHIYRRPRDDDAKLYKLLGPGVRWMDLKTPAAATLVELRSLLIDLVEEISGESEPALYSRIVRAKDILGDSLALRLLLEQASASLDEPHHLLADGYLANGSGQHGDWLERLSATKPSKTVVAHIGKDTYGYVHPFEPRPITIREAARVQSFPDWFQFGGVGVVDAYSMIGNAVPPFLSKQFADRISFLLSNGSTEIQAGIESQRSPSQTTLHFEELF